MSAPRKEAPTPKPYKLIVAGGRDFMDFATLLTVLDPITKKRRESFDGLVVVSGKAPGADKLGEQWAHLHKLKVLPFPAPWDEWEGKPEQEVVTRADGTKYWRRAGMYRNQQMAEEADGLIAFWDGQSSGTYDMIKTARGNGLKVRVYNTVKDKLEVR